VNKKFFLVIAFTLFLLSLIAFSSLAQQVNLTTYYPAPYGAYQRITVADRVLISPQATPPATCTPGEIYVSSTTGTKLCQPDGAGHNVWATVGGFSSGSAGGHPVVYNEDPSVRVGVGTSAPTQTVDIVQSQAALRIKDSDANGAECVIQTASKEANIGTVSNSPVNIRSNNSTKMIVTNDGVGVGNGIVKEKITAPFVGLRNINVVNSDVNEPSSGGHPTYIVFSNNSTPNAVYSIGVDDSGLLKINAGDGLLAAPQIQMTSTGDVKINGSLSVKTNMSDPLAEVRVKYSSGTGPSDAGYYATYAP
jgi:hypothetical protein